MERGSPSISKTSWHCIFCPRGRQKRITARNRLEAGSEGRTERIPVTFPHMPATLLNLLIQMLSSNWGTCWYTSTFLFFSCFFFSFLLTFLSLRTRRLSNSCGYKCHHLAQPVDYPQLRNSSCCIFSQRCPSWDAFHTHGTSLFCEYHCSSHLERKRRGSRLQYNYWERYHQSRNTDNREEWVYQTRIMTLTTLESWFFFLFDLVQQVKLSMRSKVFS